ncbi:complement C3-like [Fundulus heteroclitus]|uniref:complement C3-like n=1 Tax=Fundulus heteroclitus TaxID=8078 RepID=UPI00165BE767|nr:complement C3-like [Fundulus heteroclitus]
MPLERSTLSVCLPVGRSTASALSACRWTSAPEPARLLQVGSLHPGSPLSLMVSLYYAIPKEKQSDCQKFNLSVELIPEKSSDNVKTYMLRIDILYKDKNSDAKITILDIGLLTGFTVETKDLDLGA